MSESGSTHEGRVMRILVFLGSNFLAAGRRSGNPHALSLPKYSCPVRLDLGQAEESALTESQTLIGQFVVHLSTTATTYMKNGILSAIEWFDQRLQSLTLWSSPDFQVLVPSGEQSLV